MITMSQMYWLTRCDGIVSMSILLCIISGIATVFLLVSYLVSKLEGYMDDLTSSCGKIMCITTFLFILFGTIVTFVPTTKEMAAIIVIPKIANNEKIQDGANKLMDLAIAWMEELKPTKENKR